MSALATLLLVGALCSDSDGPDRVCTYVDVTVRMQIHSDAECLQVADIGNRQNIGQPDTPRYSCITRARFLTLLGETDNRNMGVL